MDDRRKFHRYESALEVRYFPRGNASKEKYTVTKDVSKGGICIPVSDTVKSGDIINLDIKALDRSTVVPALGRVVWTRSLNRPAILNFTAGVEFIRIDPKDAARLCQPFTV